MTQAVLPATIETTIEEMHERHRVKSEVTESIEATLGEIQEFFNYREEKVVEPALQLLGDRLSIDPEVVRSYVRSSADNDITHKNKLVLRTTIEGHGRAGDWQLLASVGVVSDTKIKHPRSLAKPTNVEDTGSMFDAGIESGVYDLAKEYPLAVSMQVCEGLQSIDQVNPTNNPEVVYTDDGRLFFIPRGVVGVAFSTDAAYSSKGIMAYSRTKVASEESHVSRQMSIVNSLEVERGIVDKVAALIGSIAAN